MLVCGFQLACGALLCTFGGQQTLANCHSCGLSDADSRESTLRNAFVLVRFPVCSRSSLPFSALRKCSLFPSALCSYGSLIPNGEQNEKNFSAPAPTCAIDPLPGEGWGDRAPIGASPKGLGLPAGGLKAGAKELGVSKLATE